MTIQSRRQGRRRVFWSSLCVALISSGVVANASAQTVSVGPYQPSEPPLNASQVSSDENLSAPNGRSYADMASPTYGMGYNETLQYPGASPDFGLEQAGIPIGNMGQYYEQAPNSGDFSQYYYPGGTLADENYSGEVYSNSTTVPSPGNHEESRPRRERTALEIWSTLLFGSRGKTSSRDEGAQGRERQSPLVMHHQHGNADELELNPIFRLFTFGWFGRSAADNDGVASGQNHYLANALDAEYLDEGSPMMVNQFYDGNSNIIDGNYSANAPNFDSQFFESTSGLGSPNFGGIRQQFDVMDADLQTLRQDVSRNVRDYSSRLADNIERQRQRATRSVRTAQRDVAKSLNATQHTASNAIYTAQRDAKRAVRQGKQQIAREVSQVNRATQNLRRNIADVSSNALRYTTTSNSATRNTPPQLEMKVANAQPQGKRQNVAPNTAPSSDTEQIIANRRRLEELNVLLAAKRPEEFSRRIRQTNALSVNPEVTPRESNDAESFEFNAARANRSKIRQATYQEEPSIASSATSSSSPRVLPTRPQAMKISDNVYLSSDVVELPHAGVQARPLRQLAQRNGAAQGVNNNVQRVRTTQEKLPNYKSSFTEDETTETNEAAPKPLSQRSSKSGSKSSPIQNLRTQQNDAEENVLRSPAKFIDPRDL